MAKAKSPPPDVKRKHRKRKQVPIPTFSPIVSSEHDKVDLSIFDTPPAKIKRVRDCDDPSNVQVLNLDDSKKDLRLEFQEPQKEKPKFAEAKKLSDHSSSINACVGNEIRSVARTDHVSTTTIQSTAELSASNKTLPTSIAHSPVTANKSIRNLQPDQSALMMSIDVLFKKVDIAVVTLKDVREAIETEYNVKLSKSNRKLVKDRLSDIINGKVQLMVSSNEGQTNKCFVPNAIASSDEVATKAAYVAKQECPPTSTRPTVLEANKSSLREISDMTMERGPQTQKNKPAQKEKQILPRPHAKSLAVGHATNLTTVHSTTLVAFPPIVQPAIERTTIPAVAIPNSTSALDECHDDDDFELPGPAFSKQTAKPLPSRTRNRIRNMPHTVVKAQALNSADCTPVPPQRDGKKRARKGSCSLCVTCPCQHGSNQTASKTSPAFGLARNDREIEMALIRRVKKLEKTCDKYENDLDQVNRELKKHRKFVTKKQEESVNRGRQQTIGHSHFLPDADVWDQQLEGVKQSRIQRELVQQAKANLFSFHPNFQPTLTQMIGVRSKTTVTDSIVEDGGQDVEDKTIEAVDETQIDAPIDDDESIDERYCAGEESALSCPVHRLKSNFHTEVSTTQSPLLSRTGVGVWAALQPVISIASRSFRRGYKEIYLCLGQNLH